LGKIVGPELFAVFLKETIDYYPNRELLNNTHRIMFAHPNLMIRWARVINRKFYPRAAKPFSKHNVARQLKKMLEGHMDHVG
jgi:hypothetical protein